MRRGERLRAARRRAGLTQVAFARLMGVSPNTVGRWERCETGTPARVEAWLAHGEVVPRDTEGIAERRALRLEMLRRHGERGKAVTEWRRQARRIINAVPD